MYSVDFGEVAYNIICNGYRCEEIYDILLNNIPFCKLLITEEFEKYCIGTPSKFNDIEKYIIGDKCFLDKFNDNELIQILSHEISHIILNHNNVKNITNRDIIKFEIEANEYSVNNFMNPINIDIYNKLIGFV